jgi:hypothetical protein
VLWSGMVRCNIDKERGVCDVVQAGNWKENDSTKHLAFLYLDNMTEFDPKFWAQVEHSLLLYYMLVQHLGCTFLFLARTNERRETVEWRHGDFPAGARTAPWAHIHPTLISLQLTLQTSSTWSFIATLMLGARTPRCSLIRMRRPRARRPRTRTTRLQQLATAPTACSSPRM